MTKEQPDYETKVRTFEGQGTGWDYRFDPELVTNGDKWSNDDWIRFIGDNWFKLPCAAKPS